MTDKEQRSQLNQIGEHLDGTTIETILVMFQLLAAHPEEIRKWGYWAIEDVEAKGGRTFRIFHASARGAIAELKLTGVGAEHGFEGIADLFANSANTFETLAQIVGDRKKIDLRTKNRPKKGKGI